ncbi:hypothetical protein BLOT_010852 [Blomia tropicalis]|nr:hypothetical protein BLOT_010852 [Blomia tropicalis]
MSKLSIKFSFDKDQSFRDFLKLSFKEQLFTDCIIYCWSEDRTGLQNQICRNYQTFKCHRLVLSAYSDFFRQFFLENQISQQNNNNIGMTMFLDIEPHTFENILNLIYFGNCEIIQTDLELFVNATTKLGVKDFKVSCSNEMSQVDQFDLNHLKRRLLQEDPSKQVKQIKQTTKYENFDSTRDSNDSPVFGADDKEESLFMHIQHQHGNISPQSEIRVTENNKVTNLPNNIPETPIGSMTVGESATHTCPICAKQYAYKISLNKHIKGAHAAT